jgi:hypothetical protein
MRQAFLTLHDYGTGGLWAYMRADSPEQIRARFRDLEVLAEAPAFMDEEQLKQIEADGVYDVETFEQHRPAYAAFLRSED